MDGFDLKWFQSTWHKPQEPPRCLSTKTLLGGIVPSAGLPRVQPPTFIASKCGKGIYEPAKEDPEGTHKLNQRDSKKNPTVCFHFDAFRTRQSKFALSFKQQPTKGTTPQTLSSNLEPSFAERSTTVQLPFRGGPAPGQLLQSQKR